MPRQLHLFAASAFALLFCLPGRSQDSPSLGDVARQAQAQKDKDKDKDKTSPPAKKVFTNDDFPSSGSGSSGSAPGLGRVVQPGQPGTPGKPGAAAAPASASDQLERMESLLNQLDSLDRTTLAKNVLEGNDTDFPGRAKWVEELFTAKQVFVAQGRDIMKKANQLQASAKGVQDMQNPNDPRAKDLSNRLQQLMQEASRAGAAFQAVIAKGKDLAGQSASC